MDLSSEIRNQPVEGRNFDGGTLGSALGENPALLVFLRHLG